LRQLTKTKQIMKKLSLLVLILFPIHAYSQTLKAGILNPEAIFCAADNRKNDNAQISWTLGDNQIKTYEKSSAILTQGFLQSKITITSVNKIIDNGNLTVNFFPNPVKDILQVNIDVKKPEQLNLSLYTIDGKMVLSKTLEPLNNKTTIDFSPYPKGIYLLKAVSENKSLVQTFKIIYQE
jgi:hypothetical protein